MAETKINASQTTITASDIGAARAATVLPTASADNVGDIVQFVGTTTASYTNGYFYKCVSDGQNPATYSWEEVEVQASSGGGLPDQTGMSGRFLTTDGSSASWSNQLRFWYSTDWLSVQNQVVLTAINGIGIGDSNGVTLSGLSVAIGSRAKAASSYGGIAIGYMPEATGNDSISIGWISKATADYAIQIGGFGKTNSDANTFKVGNNNGNFEMMSADGTIPEARLADTTNAAQGDVLTLDANLNAVWTAGGSGGGVSDVTVNGTSVVSGGVAAITGMLQNTSLRPSDSLTILGTPSTNGYTNNINIGSGSDYAGSSVFIGYRAKKSDSYTSSTVCIGSNAKAGNSSVAIGCSAEIEGSYGVAYSTVIGGWAKCTQSYSMQFGRGTNSEEGTVCFGTRLADSTWVNYKLLDRDGTIPEARLGDTTNATAGQVLTLDSNLNAAWATPSGGGASSATATLAVNDWSSNTQTVNVTGVTASNNVIVAAAPASQADYTSAGILCTAQGAGTLTFTCTTVPSSAITVNVLII